MITGYPLDRVCEEIAFIAYHFHWSYEEIVNMEHRERQRWVQEISKINHQISGEEQRSILEV
jgi:transcriptional antiterminator